MTAAGEGGLRAGIDIGGTGLRLVMLQAGREVAAVTLPTATFERYARADRPGQLARYILQLLPARSHLLSLGIGASGPVDMARGVIENPGTLPVFSGFALVAPLREQLQIPVAIDNDAVTAALGEFHLGAGVGSQRLLTVTLGTGVGVALLVNGQPWRAVDGSHPEGGHIPVSDDLHQCYCGLSGCWETLASRSWLQTQLATLLPDVAYERQDLAFFQARAADDVKVRELFEQYGRQVGRGLNSLAMLYGPDLIVLGGSAARLYPLYEASLRGSVRRKAGFELNMPIVPSSIGDAAGALGAALLPTL
ncbi:ROK family protein [Pseudomonas petrae]|uniref:ROK family protein n=1 Tax=Pseudomonas petrae TaxID=2912190 RepID=A0ABS9I970_9PSED|nr:ROK family protein [Pseudomonas petrae]MCF7531012.1 ROK family protein [Pseudomonas petrae]MCF7536688.1 ROK family protein [Pseudomonas petrae]MCF7544299.1 ROK family protein [Pseudomonas petrae]MCF7554367.1 ROK family protein [Pseudomonas petrae]